MSRARQLWSRKIPKCPRTYASDQLLLFHTRDLLVGVSKIATHDILVKHSRPLLPTVAAGDGLLRSGRVAGPGVWQRQATAPQL